MNSSKTQMRPLSCYAVLCSRWLLLREPTKTAATAAARPKSKRGSALPSCCSESQPAATSVACLRSGRAAVPVACCNTSPMDSCALPGAAAPAACPVVTTGSDAGALPDGPPAALRPLLLPAAAADALAMWDAATRGTLPKKSMMRTCRRQTPRLWEAVTQWMLCRSGNGSTCERVGCAALAVCQFEPTASYL